MLPSARKSRVAASVSSGTVMVEQQALGFMVWAALAPLFKGLGQAVVDVPTGADHFVSLRDMVVT